MYMEPVNNRKLKISCTDRTSRIFRSLQTVSEKIFGHNQSGSHGFQVQLVTGCDISVFFTNLRYISPMLMNQWIIFLKSLTPTGIFVTCSPCSMRANGPVWNIRVLASGALWIWRLGPLHMRAKNRDHEIVRAQKKVSKGRPKTLSKLCIVVTNPQV